MRLSILALCILLLCESYSARAAEKRAVEPALKSMFLMNLHLKKVVKERRKLETQRVRSQATVQRLKKSIEEKAQRKARHQKFLISSVMDQKDRMRDSLVGLILLSQSPASLERKAKAVRIISDYQSTLVRDYLRDIELVAIEQRKVEKELAKIVRMDEKLKAKETEALARLNAKSAYLGKLRETKSESLAKLRNMKSHKNQRMRDEALMLEKVLNRSALYELRGKLNLPVRGRVTQYYGDYLDPDFGVQVPHSGLFVDAEEGAPVSTVFEGTISYLDSIPGLGTTLVVDHGDHFYSVYSALERVEKKVGDSVKRGEVLAFAGTSVTHGRSGVYFELRHFSEPIDPSGWIGNVAMETAAKEQTR